MSETTFYFVIGHRRCGTTSINAFFNRNGIASIHYDRGRLGHTMRMNLLQGAPPLAGYDHIYSRRPHVFPDDFPQRLAWFKHASGTAKSAWRT